tara:strand:+ start:1542 stop:1700 length:159 start_codon:yes stop_codon:yes gene_type:complete
MCIKKIIFIRITDVLTIEDPTRSIIGNISIKKNDIFTVGFSLKISRNSFFIF